MTRGQPDEVRGNPVPSVGLAGNPMLVIVAAIGAAWMSWRFTRFRVAEHQVEPSGLIFRQQRQVPLDRVQAVEISRPLVAQILDWPRSSCTGREADPTSPRLPCPPAGARRARPHPARRFPPEGYAAGLADEGARPAWCSPPRGTEGPYGSLPGDLLGLAPTPGAWSCRCPTCGSCWPASATREWSSSSRPGSRGASRHSPSSRRVGPLRRDRRRAPGAGADALRSALHACVKSSNTAISA